MGNYYERNDHPKRILPRARANSEKALNSASSPTLIAAVPGFMFGIFYEWKIRDQSHHL
jgi:hypothetical protein